MCKTSHFTNGSYHSFSPPPHSLIFHRVFGAFPYFASQSLNPPLKMKIRGVWFKIFFYGNYPKKPTNSDFTNIKTFIRQLLYNSFDSFDYKSLMEIN